MNLLAEAAILLAFLWRLKWASSFVSGGEAVGRKNNMRFCGVCVHTTSNTSVQRQPDVNLPSTLRIKTKPRTCKIPKLEPDLILV